MPSAGTRIPVSYTHLERLRGEAGGFFRVHQGGEAIGHFLGGGKRTAAEHKDARAIPPGKERGNK